MKIYLAGVPGGGSPGTGCKRERENLRIYSDIGSTHITTSLLQKGFL